MIKAIVPMRPVMTGIVLAALTLQANAAERIVTMLARPSRPGLDAMPRIAAPADAAERRINAALAGFDADARASARQCARFPDGGFERSVLVTMRGPAYLSYVISDAYDCGGVHPDGYTSAITYDLRTGLPVDWSRILPAGLAGRIEPVRGAGARGVVTIGSRRLATLFRAAYSNGAAECQKAIESETAAEPPPRLTPSLDATTHGLALQLNLVHFLTPCADPVTLPAAILLREGLAPRTAAAIEAGR